MGIDKSLGKSFPTVVIGGEVYEYGKVPDCSYWMDGFTSPYPDEWVVEHRTEAKDSWYFRTERAMVDFLENLPESAVCPTIRGVPLWMLGQRDRVVRRLWKQHRRQLVRLLRWKRKEGTTFRYRG